MLALLLALLPAHAQDAPDAPPADVPVQASADEVSLDAPAVEEAQAEDAAPVEIVDPIELVWTGALGGIGSGTTRFDLHTRVPEGTLEAVRPIHGWLVQRSFLLRAGDGRVATLGALLSGPETPRCTPVDTVTVLTSPTEHLVIPGELPDWAGDLGLRQRTAARLTCTAGEAQAELLRLGAAEDLPKWEASQWETRLGLAWILADGTGLDVVSVPQSEGTRRIAALEQAVADGAIFVDAGSFVDGASSVQEASLSLHRPTGFDALRRHSPAALVPGMNELVAGYDVLKAEAPDLPYTAANWRAEDPARALPDHRLVRTEDLTVAFIGVIDPAVARSVPRLADEGITLVDPVRAIPPVVQALGDEVDLVVLLGDLPPDRLAGVRREVAGVDLILGDASADLAGARHLEVALAAPDPWTPSTPVTLPLGGVYRGRIDVQDGRPTRILTVPVPITPAIDPDPEALARVTDVRLSAYPGLDHPLLPAADPTNPLPPDVFAKAICESIQDRTAAELVLLPRLGTPETPGPLTELLVVDELAMPDTLELHRVPGDRFAKLLDQLVGMVPTTCGAPLAERFPKARGRYLENDRVYRVVTTDRLRRSSPELSSLLDTGHGALGVLDPQAVTPIRSDSGEVLTLRGAALDSLRELRKTWGEGLLDELVARDATRLDPQWLLRVSQLSLRVEGFQGVEDDVYGEVPETLATSPSSFTLGTATDAALEYSDRRLAWDARARSVFTRLRTADQVQETADDLKLSTSLSLPGVSTPEVAGISLRPYAEGLYDSEITAVENDDGTSNPLQRDLSLTLGASAARKGILRTLRVGAFGLVDLSRPEKQPELGARAEAETLVTFGPRLRWTTSLNAFLYGSTEDDDASDLRFKARMDSRLQLPLSRWLGLALYGTGFAFQGRVPETRAVAASYSLGASVDVSGIFELR